ncbi:MAG: hypothetical protein U5L10_01050 [Candidatus Moranbacteria bacterium]|nr:hypothetical protein [Candidatus Moranbacteria bacterium]
MQQREVLGTGFVLAVISCNLDPEDGDIFKKPSQADFSEILPPEYINWEATKHRRR